MSPLFVDTTDMFPWFLRFTSQNNTNPTNVLISSNGREYKTNVYKSIVWKFFDKTENGRFSFPTVIKINVQ